MSIVETNTPIAKRVAVAFQIAGYAFLLWFVPTIKSVVTVPVILVFALVYLSGVRAISRWLQSTIDRAAAYNSFKRKPPRGSA